MKHISHDIVFEPDGGEGDGGGTGDGDGDGAGDGDGDDDQELTPEEVKEVLAENARLKAQQSKARTEAARRAKAEKDEQRRKAEKDGDQSALQKQLDEAQAKAEKAEQKFVQSQARAIAAELGAVDSGDVVALLNWDAMVDPSDENEQRQAIRNLLKEKPHLRKSTKNTDGGEGGGGNTGRSMNDIIRSRGR